MKVIRDIVAGLSGPVVTYFTRRAELKQSRFEAKLQLEIAIGDRQAKLISEGLAADANWEMEFARQAANSNKDEWVLGVLSVPAILCFIDLPLINGPKIVLSGFASLGEAPVWYSILLCSVFASTVGIRWWRRKQTDTD
jgi:hypothetical protein